ncbi:hypothetical protein C8Q76DRAFT_567007, partial [Earliella scabrosa]
LPSSLPETSLLEGRLAHLGKCEYELRVGHAYDILSSVRMSVRKTAALIADKDRNARGTKDNLRSQDTIKSARGRSVLLAGMYNSNLDRLSMLASMLTSEDDPMAVPGNLRRIDSTKDLQMSTLTKLRNSGDSKRTLPWIFRRQIMRRTRPCSYRFTIAALRVDWFRARAAKTRTDEEINLLLADSRATRRGFQFAAKQFSGHAVALAAYQSPGATAYALEKADMFSRMSSDCERRVAAA